MLRAVKFLSLIAGLLVIALGLGCGLDPMETLGQQIASPDAAKKQEAVLELANLSDPRAIKKLVDALEVDKDVCDQAAVALVKKGREAIRRPKENPVGKAIAEVAKSDHVGLEFRARAAWALGEIGDRRAIADLKGLAGDADSLGLEAKRALEKLGFKNDGAAFDLPPEVLGGTLAALPNPPALLEPATPPPA